MNIFINCYNKITKTLPPWMLHLLFFSIWVAIHVSAIYYGTSQLPFHSSYVGDEQSPVTAALQILQSKSLLAIYNLESLYYGPLFAVLALPPIIFDFITSSFTSGVWSVAEYKNHILYDWGGIIWKSRVVALLFGYLGIVGLYKILTTKLVNPKTNLVPVFIGLLLLSTNFYYFEYSAFFKHWIFILVPVIWQVYLLILMSEKPEKIKFYFSLQALLATFAFGISYLSLLSQIIFLPIFINSIKSKSKIIWSGFLSYFTILIPVSVVIIAWNPAQVMRYLDIFSNHILHTGGSQYTTGVDNDSSALIYFTEVFLTNHSLIFIAGIILFVCFIKKKSNDLRSIIISVILLGVLYFIIAVVQSNHVSRYVLPTILALLLGVSILLTFLYSSLGKKVRILIIGLICINVIYHVVSIVFWSQMMSVGPMERRAVSEIIEYQSVSNSETVVVINSKLLGWPHTQESYTNFASARNIEDRPLFMAYANSSPPKESLLSVSYASSAVNVIELSTKRLIVECIDPQDDELLGGDYSEVRLYRLWTSDYYWQYHCNTYFK